MQLKEKKIAKTRPGATKAHAPRSTELSKRFTTDRDRFVAKGVFQFHSLFVETGNNAVLKDVDGNEYLDFTSGIGTLNVGHCHPAVVEAIRRQAGQMLHISMHVASYSSYVKVCERLVSAAPGIFPKKAVLFNSGAEAVENAVKVARAFTGRQGIISFDLGFHGRTFLALGLTGKQKPYRQKFGPFPGETYRAPYPYAYRPPEGVRSPDLTRHCLGRLESLFTTSVSPDNVAAIIIEPVLGEGGIVVPPPDFLPALRRLCDRYGILLVADEVQSGFGRTGKMFAVEHSGVVPDLITVAKSMAAGLPLSGIVGRAEILDSVEPGGLGGTFGGNPLSCAAAMGVFDIIEHQNLLGRGAHIGKIMAERLDGMKERCEIIGDSRGVGPMRALELVRSRASREPLGESEMKQVLARCAERGVLLIKAGQFGNVIRILPPLTIGPAELEKGLDVVEDVLSRFRN
ncbi:MAG: 4-aminobutyrate--2-oxoglutarate transaminase [Elusimicrobia bacterium]|nr:4-aminobutyrate--2-oxoglutarate transaminase [Elusimicrobiota bacterium]